MQFTKNYVKKIAESAIFFTLFATKFHLISGILANSPDVKVHPLEPAESPTLSTGHRVGKHRIQSILDMSL
jgi:hypothetical protein